MNSRFCSNSQQALLVAVSLLLLAGCGSSTNTPVLVYRLPKGESLGGSLVQIESGRLLEQRASASAGEGHYIYLCLVRANLATKPAVLMDNQGKELSSVGTVQSGRSLADLKLVMGLLITEDGFDNLYAFYGPSNMDTVTVILGDKRWPGTRFVERAAFEDALKSAKLANTK